MVKAMNFIWPKLQKFEQISCINMLAIQAKQLEIEATKKNSGEKKIMTNEDLLHYIREERLDLYDKVLLFIPLELDDVYLSVSQVFNVSKKELLIQLDQISVFVTISPAASKEKKRSYEKKRKGKK